MALDLWLWRTFPRCHLGSIVPDRELSLDLMKKVLSDWYFVCGLGLARRFGGLWLERRFGKCEISTWHRQILIISRTIETLVHR